MVLSADNSTLYVANAAAPAVAYCPITSPGVVGTCQTAYSLPGGQIMHGGIALGKVGGTTYGYYTLSSGGAGGASIYVCTVNTSTHIWSDCQPTTGTLFEDALPLITVNANSSYAYVGAGSYLYQCSINSDGTLMSCTEEISDLDGAMIGLTINGSNNYLYASTNSNVIYNCPVASDGSLGSCTSSGTHTFPDALGIAAN